MRLDRVSAASDVPDAASDTTDGSSNLGQTSSITVQLLLLGRAYLILGEWIGFEEQALTA